jgi:hypothetical protein
VIWLSGVKNMISKIAIRKPLAIVVAVISLPVLIVLAVMRTMAAGRFPSEDNIEKTIKADWASRSINN